MTNILTRTEYLQLAIQFDERARTSVNPKEAEEYRARAAVFRQLAEARLPVTIPEGNFVRRAPGRKRKPKPEQNQK
jgi:hypothetical protein